MKRIFIITSIILIALGCIGNAASNDKYPTGTVQANDSSPSEDIGWNVYDPDPNHLWNRVFRQFYRRVSQDGKEHGMDELDPLLWFDTTHLLEGNSHQDSIHVLDEFLRTNADTLIHDPLKRAMFQRDLWAVFDWLAFQTEPFPSQREALKTRLVKIIRRVALTKDEILSLTDNYTLAVESKMFPGDFQFDQPQAAFLPLDLFHSNSAWIPMGREGGPIAMSHTERFPFLGRSVFLVFVRNPEGRKATIDFIQSLNTESQSELTIGSAIALVRRMFLIDDQGDLILSPLIETVQIRHFNPEQIFHEFELSRMHLFGGPTGGLHLNKELLMLFFSHGDVFERDHGPELQATVPGICKACHLNIPGVLDSGNMQSLVQTILSYSRINFPLPNNERAVLIPTSWENETQLVIAWKHKHDSWQTLQMLWNQETP